MSHNPEAFHAIASYIEECRASLKRLNYSLGIVQSWEDDNSLIPDDIDEFIRQNFYLIDVPMFLSLIQAYQQAFFFNNELGDFFNSTAGYAWGQRTLRRQELYQKRVDALPQPDNAGGTDPAALSLWVLAEYVSIDRMVQLAKMPSPLIQQYMLAYLHAYNPGLLKSLDLSPQTTEN